MKSRFAWSLTTLTALCFAASTGCNGILGNSLPTGLAGAGFGGEGSGGESSGGRSSGGSDGLGVGGQVGGGLNAGGSPSGGRSSGGASSGGGASSSGGAGGGATGGALGSGGASSGGAATGGDGNCTSGCAPQIVQVASGYDHSCALFDTGALKCWGGNDSGQLGLGDNVARGLDLVAMGDALPAVEVAGAGTIEQLELGYQFTCIRSSVGDVRCWGRNAHGELGSGASDDLNVPPVERVDLDGAAALQIAAGGSHVCALRGDGAVLCWGYNSEGELGQGHTVHMGNNPNSLGYNLKPVPLPAKARLIDAGETHTCAVLVTDDVYCWGDNADGQLGVGDVENRGDDEFDLLEPVRPAENLSVVQLALGKGYSCALMSDGGVRCWGYNGAGQLGLGNTSSVGGNLDEAGGPFEAASVAPNTVELRTTFGHTCALNASGRVSCWGFSYVGALGPVSNESIGDQPEDVLLPFPSLDLGPVDKAIHVAAGQDFSCALLVHGAVKCWGDNKNGQLGAGILSEESSQNFASNPADLNEVPLW